MKRVLLAALGQGHTLCASPLPSTLPDFQRYYLDMISCRTVILGRRTWESFGAGLPCDQTIVLSRQRDIPDVTVAHSLDEALAQAEAVGSCTVFAGGAEVFQEVLDLDLADELVLLSVKNDPGSKHAFPLVDLASWDLIQRKYHPQFVYYHYRSGDAKVGCGCHTLPPATK